MESKNVKSWEAAMIATRFTELVGCAVPIQQAGMGAAAPPELLAAWSEPVGFGRAGCDFVVAQGIEAGGHVRGTTPTMTLLSEVITAVDIPVLAAGGIGTGRAMAAALAAGADGVRVGTRFVAAVEAAVHPEY